MRDFETKNLLIRKFKMEDVEDVHRNLATEKELAECYGYNIHESMYETEVMVASLIKEYEMDELIWGIEDKSNSELIGFINASERSEVHKICKLNFGIAIKKVDSGYMEEALKVIINYLLNEKNFNVVVSYFYDGYEKLVQIKSKILENVGMSKEATLYKRKINKKTGKTENKIVYSIFK